MYEHIMLIEKCGKCANHVHCAGHTHTGLFIADLRVENTNLRLGDIIELQSEKCLIGVSGNAILGTTRFMRRLNGPIVLVSRDE